MSSEKLNELKSLVRSLGSCVVAYSGGVDSVLLAVVAHEVLGDRAVAAIADSPSLPRHELAEARELARHYGFRLHELHTEEFSQNDYVSNPVNRCYFCKAELFRQLIPFAREHDLKVIVYGENSSDVGDYRPGRVAADEYDVRAPLREVGLTKAEIRALSRDLGLPTAEKPAQPCLSSRIPYGEIVSPEKLSLIEQGEALIRARGFQEVRVRLHELKSGYLGRIELASQSLGNFFAEGHAGELDAELKRVGFQHVTVDMAGYRQGSLNEGIRGKSGPAQLISSDAVD